jgi:hypothetical protein
MADININVGGSGTLSIGSVNQGSNINVSSSGLLGYDQSPVHPSSPIEASQEINKPCKTSSPRTHPAAVKFFLSYSHKDESFRMELQTHLKMLEHEGLISLWQDHEILPGDAWNTKIEEELNAAEIILFLVSADFIASDYCWGKEVETAMALHACGQATLVPILVRHCDWKTAKFAQLQSLPVGMIPVSAWDDRDQAWTNVVQSLRDLICEKQSRT